MKNKKGLLYTKMKIFHFKEKIDSLLQTLKNMSLTQRKKYLRIDPVRADIILAGTVILKQFLEIFGFDKILISDKSLRWGVLEQIKAKMFNKKT